MKERELPPVEELRNLLSYDPETGELHWKVKRGTRAKIGDHAGCNAAGYISIKINGLAYRAHRIAWAIFYGEIPSGWIDHMNGVRSDNRISNLRLATPSENTLNSFKRNKFGHRGISRIGNKFQANLRINGNSIYLGLHEKLEDAISARLRAEEEHEVYVRSRAQTGIEVTRFES